MATSSTGSWMYLIINNRMWPVDTELLEKGDKVISTEDGFMVSGIVEIGPRLNKEGKYYVTLDTMRHK